MRELDFEDAAHRLVDLRQRHAPSLDERRQILE